MGSKPFAAKLGAFCLAPLCATLSWSANAQVDAGQVFRELTPEMVEPMPSRQFQIETPDLSRAEPGGPTVQVEGVTFEGYSLYSQEELLAVVKEYLHKPQDLAGLRAMANQVSRFYRDQGYLFARAVLPPQSTNAGIIRVSIIEGRYGEVRTHGHPDLYPAAQSFLEPLRAGGVIESTQLERSTLILSDQPGIEAIPVIKPGKEAGTGDLDVEIRRGDRFSGEIGLDNHGNRYTGRHRMRAGVQAGSTFLLGDEISLLGLYTEEDLMFGSLQYALPVGGSGLRAFAGLSYSDYELGKEFAVLGVTGKALAREVGLSYPMVRSQKANLSLHLSHEYKELEDSQDNSHDNRKTSSSLPISLRFDYRDGWGPWGITYGQVSAKLGRLDLDDDLSTFDLGHTEGDFQILALDVVRLQGLPENFSLMARLRAQYAFANLDSSEGMSLGGPNGVRAYPLGEASGDDGWLGQIELRYRYENYTPYVFFDAGRIRINAKDYDTTANSRDLSGLGLGMKYDRKPWHGDLSIAWSTGGGDPESTSKKETPVVWANFGYRF